MTGIWKAIQIFCNKCTLNVIITMLKTRSDIINIKQLSSDKACLLIQSLLKFPYKKHLIDWAVKFALALCHLRLSRKFSGESLNRILLMFLNTLIQELVCVVDVICIAQITLEMVYKAFLIHDRGVFFWLGLRSDLSACVLNMNICPILRLNSPSLTSHGIGCLGKPE